MLHGLYGLGGFKSTCRGNSELSNQQTNRPYSEGNNVEGHQSIVDFTARVYKVYEDIWLPLSRLKHY